MSFLVNPAGPWADWAFNPRDKPELQTKKASIASAKMLNIFQDHLPHGLRSCLPLRRGDTPTGVSTLECFADGAEAIRDYFVQNIHFFIPLLANADAD